MRQRGAGDALVAYLDKRPVMSTATRFKFHQPFPVCIKTTAECDAISVAHDWVRNLTLTQVMAFFWNLETFTLTTAASVSATGYSGTANGTFTLSPLAVSGDWTEDFFGANNTPPVSVNGWIEVDGTTAELAFGDVSTQPRERVCHQPLFKGAVALYLLGQDTRGSDYSYCYFDLIVARDSVNAGKYAIGHYMLADFPIFDVSGTPTPSGYHLGFSTRLTAGFGSGTFTLGGITFPYHFGTTLPSGTPGYTATGGTVTATSSNYTY